MPQFEDIHLFIPQVFWFVLCFIVLYFFMSQIILPRIRDILEARQTTIDSDLTCTKNIEDVTLSYTFFSSDYYEPAKN